MRVLLGECCVWESGGRAVLQAVLGSGEECASCEEFPNPT